MSGAKITPGTWFADEARVDDWRVRADDGKGGFWEIAEMSSLNPKANARGIAFLPELIDAARYAHDACWGDDSTLQQKNAARMLRRILAGIDGD